jgi:2-keto-myo-inositol isomerase
MKLALNGATTMKADLETDLRVAQAAGFDYVEIWAAKLRRYLQTRSAADLKALFTECHLEPLSINSIEHITFRSPDDYQSIKHECERLCRIAEVIGCPHIVVVPGRLPTGGATRPRIIEKSVRVLSELCDIAAKHGVNLAFEFLGQTDCSVPTLELAHEIVKAVDKPNLGLVLDSFHFYAGGSSIQMIEALNPRLLYIFHINDAEDRPRSELQDAHRLLPGLGILPLADITAAFERIGYDKVASVEIFRPAYWEMDPLILAQEAHRATAKVLAQI